MQVLPGEIVVFWPHCWACQTKYGVCCSKHETEKATDKASDKADDAARDAKGTAKDAKKDVKKNL